MIGGAVRRSHRSPFLPALLRIGVGAAILGLVPVDLAAQGGGQDGPGSTSASDPDEAARVVAVAGSSEFRDTAAIGPGAAASPAAPIRTLTGGRESPKALAQAVLEALEAGDEAALRRLLVTEEEHRQLLWDELPERNYLPFRYVRWLNEHNSEKGLRRALRRYGGVPLELVSLEFADEMEEYEDFSVHPGAELTVRHAEHPERVGKIEILDVFVEVDGVWKLLDYEE